MCTCGLLISSYRNVRLSHCNSQVHLVVVGMGIEAVEGVAGRGGRGGDKGGTNNVHGESVYGEKWISIESGVEDTKSEYRVWNPFLSKLAARVFAGVLGGLDDIFIKPGGKVLYLGAASRTSVSHVANIVGPVCLFPSIGYVHVVSGHHTSDRHTAGCGQFRRVQN